MVLSNRPIPAAVLDRADPLARGLVCAAMMTEPGGASANLANAGLLVGTPAAGGLATNVTGIHQPWHNRFGSGYTFALWHSGITLGIYGALLYVGDNTLHWQRYGFNDYLRVYHNGVGQSMSDFLTSEIANPGLLVCLWDGSRLRAYVDGVEVGSAAMATAPKTTSTTNTLTIGGSCTVYQFLAYDRALSAAEIRQLTGDPHTPFGQPAARFAAILAGGTAGTPQTLAGSLTARSSLTGGLKVTRSLAGNIEAFSEGAAALQVRRSLSGEVRTVTQLTGAIRVKRFLSGSLAVTTTLSGRLLTGVEIRVLLSGSIHVVATLAATLRIFREPTGRAAVLEAMALADAETVLGEMLTEPAVYEPQGGAVRSVQVVVDRQAPHLASSPRRTVRPLRIWAKNAVDGIAAAEVQKGDVVRVSRHVGGDAVPMRVVRRVGQTDGWCELEVQ